MDTVVLVIVVGARFLAPFLIFRFPLPGLALCFVLDAADQTVFQAFSTVPSDYEGYDKAMDTFYLSMAYLAMLRNWTDLGALRIGRALFYYRLIGAVVYELYSWPPFLLIFANTFEYYFVAYELFCTRWSPRRLHLRAWVGVALAIWVVIKLPQETWLHVLHLDVTNQLGRHPWAIYVLALVTLGLVVGYWKGVHPRLPPPDDDREGGRIVAAALPDEIDDQDQRREWRAEYGKILSWVTLEKILLVGLVSLIYGEVLPGTSLREAGIFIGAGAVTFASAVVTLVTAKRHWDPGVAVSILLLRLGLNAVIIFVGYLLTMLRGGDFGLLQAGFFLVLITVITTVYDRFHPVLAWRERRERAAFPSTGEHDAVSLGWRLGRMLSGG